MRMRDLIRIVEGTSPDAGVAPTLYHGTCSENAASLIQNGWAPHSGERGGNLGQTRYLYLSTGYEDALWFAHEKGCDTVLELHGVPLDHLEVDPEDGSGDTLADELNSPLGLPGKVVLTKPLAAGHFRRVTSPLSESREAPLYHGTGVGNALHILATDRIEDRTQHDGVFGVSLSRSRRVAASFGEVVFALDQRRLALSHRIVPNDYWGRSKEPALVGAARRHGKYAEDEEFVVGSIGNAARYVVAILISEKTVARIRRNFPETALPLLSHQKLRITA